MADYLLFALGFSCGAIVIVCTAVSVHAIWNMRNAPLDPDEEHWDEEDDDPPSGDDKWAAYFDSIE